MTILGGHFAVMLIVSAPGGPDRERAGGRARHRRSRASGSRRSPSAAVSTSSEAHAGAADPRDHRLRGRPSGDRPLGQQRARRARGQHHRPADAARRNRRIAALRDDARGRARPDGGAAELETALETVARARPSRSSFGHSRPRRSERRGGPACAVRDVLLYPDPRLKQVCGAGAARRCRARRGGPAGDDGRSRPLRGDRRAAARRARADRGRRRQRAPEGGDHNGRLVLVNPRIVASEGSRGRARGVPVDSRPDREREAGEPIAVEHAGGTVESEGFEARCIQHEIDHLDGILFLDRVASIVDDVFRRKSYSG